MSRFCSFPVAGSIAIAVSSFVKLSPLIPIDNEKSLLLRTSKFKSNSTPVLTSSPSFTVIEAYPTDGPTLLSKNISVVVLL